MKRGTLSILFCALAAAFCCNKAQAQQQYAFRVSFTDKTGSPDLSNPLQLLSQRALDRRNGQNIVLDETDRPVSQPYIDTVLDLTGGILHLTSRWMNDCVVLVEDSADIFPLQGKAWITGIKHIAYYPAGLHQRTSAKEEVLSNTAKTTGLPSYYGGSWNQTELVHGDCLHDASFKGEGKMIAVIDDGFKYVDTNPGFSKLVNEGRIKDVHNFVKANNEVFSLNTEHGTNALSTVAGVIETDTIRYIGAAIDAEYVLYVSEHQGTEQPIEMDNFVAALERADSVGVDVVTASVGYNTFDFPFEDLQLTDIDGKSTHAAKGVNFASAKGMVCVITAGNEGGGSWNKILTPGDADSALTIGNVNSNGVPAGSSGYGPNAAGRTKPDVVALGSNAIVFSSTPVPGGIGGTSFATPQIAGFASCLWQAYPWASAAQIRQTIRQTGSQFANPGNQIGYGVPDFCEALQTLQVPDVKAGKEALTVYPNPATDAVTISLPDDMSNASLQLLDMKGRVVYTTVVNAASTVLTVSALPAGVYMLKAAGNHGISVQRLVKQ